MINSVRGQLYKDFVKQYTYFHSSNVKNKELLYVNAQSEIRSACLNKRVVFKKKFNMDVQRGGVDKQRTNPDRREVGVQKHQIYLDVLNGWPQNH
jgi:hypothetical protein